MNINKKGTIKKIPAKKIVKKINKKKINDEQIIEVPIKTAINARQEGLDKFYTIPTIVDLCIEKLLGLYAWDSWELIIEPSAGNGSFLLKIPSVNKIGLDIAPEHADIIKQDFFKYTPPSDKKILVIGNPPFGKICSLAIGFFNHAAKWANTIAFIIPRTFRRISVQNKLNQYFHLVLDIEIPTTPCSFSPPMAVKCCFQIWTKKLDKRNIINLGTVHDDWTFLPFGPKDDKNQPTPPLNADFAMRAYGGKCGELKTTELNTLRPKSWHWIKCNINKELLIDRFSKLDYSGSKDTARQNSFGRGELVELYNNYVNNQ